MLVVQALKATGQVHADADFIKSLSKRFDYNEWSEIEKASCKVADWILVAIRQAKEIAQNG
jgi:hypothetical protein